MEIAILYGSVRSSRQGIKAAKFIENKLKEKGHDTKFVDAKEYGLPFLDKMYKEYAKGEAPENMEKLHQIFQKVDGFVIVSGEYNHSIPPALKNMLDHFQSEYNFKPSAIVSYSAGGFGGVRVAMHLRAVLAELGMPSIPSIFPVLKVQNTIDENGIAIDKNYDKYVVRFIAEFEWYLAAFKSQREKGVPY